MLATRILLYKQKGLKLLAYDQRVVMIENNLEIAAKSEKI